MGVKKTKAKHPFLRKLISVASQRGTWMRKHHWEMEIREKEKASKRWNQTHDLASFCFFMGYDELIFKFLFATCHMCNILSKRHQHLYGETFCNQLWSKCCLLSPIVSSSLSKLIGFYRLKRETRESWCLSLSLTPDVAETLMQTIDKMVTSLLTDASSDWLAILPALFIFNWFCPLTKW